VEQQCQETVWKQTAERVHFGLYYETLCPDCQQFVRDQLWPAYNKLANITDLQLVPYGNANVSIYFIFYFCTLFNPPRVLTASSLLVLKVITQEADCFGQSSLVSSNWLGPWRK
jgi:hypothetical protein